LEELLLSSFETLVSYHNIIYITTQKTLTWIFTTMKTSNIYGLIFSILFSLIGQIFFSLMNQQICWIWKLLSGWKTTFRTGLPHYLLFLMIGISLTQYQQIFWISIHNVLMHTGWY